MPITMPIYKAHSLLKIGKTYKIKPSTYGEYFNVTYLGKSKDNGFTDCIWPSHNVFSFDRSNKPHQDSWYEAYYGAEFNGPESSKKTKEMFKNGVFAENEGLVELSENDIFYRP